jgi:succinate dehydrogenase/fumarate reductase flavoprotein subunit
LVQLDPIMWDPFRYKLGGRLLNGDGEEFLGESGDASGAYTTPRDTATYKIFREVEEGRGSPHGGAYLDFRMVGADALKAGFGPVIDILARQGIDLTRDMVEVSPTAHFMLGGIAVDSAMNTGVEGLLACGEAMAGMHGANRLSGNAITEALVTGRIAGETAAARGTIARTPIDAALAQEWARLQTFWHPRAVTRDELPIDALKVRLQQTMWENAGPLRTGDKLVRALADVRALAAESADVALAPVEAFALNLQEKVELRMMLAVAESIVLPAIERRESRGAHVRLDFPQQDERANALFLAHHANGWSVTSREVAVTA